jgi:hypothetical protein
MPKYPFAWLDTMHIFLGALIFLFATAALVYAPGALLLRLLNRSLSPLDHVTLSCVIGLLISASVYWIFGFFNLFHLYFLWPLLATVAFAAFPWPGFRLRRPSPVAAASCQEEIVTPIQDGSWLVLVGIAALGITILALLPQYYTNLIPRSDGTMQVYPVDDVFLHLAIANELTHTIPPQTPAFAGHPLTYHYGMDLVVAMFATLTHLNTRDLTLRFSSTFFLLLSMLSVFCFARRQLSSNYFACLIVFLVFFGEDFSFIPGLLQKERIDWSVIYFQEPTVFSLFYINPMLPALGLLFAGLFCLSFYLRDRNSVWLVLSALLIVALLEVKVFTALQLMLSLGLVSCIYFARFRDTRLFYLAVLTALLSLPLVLGVFWGNKAGADIIMTAKPWPYVTLATKQLGLAGLSHHWLSFFVLAAPIYFLGCFGLRIVGFARIASSTFWPKRDFGLECLLGFFILLGAGLTMTLRIVPAGLAEAFNNSGWFLVQSKYLAWIFAVAALQDFYRRFVARGARPMVAGTFVALVAVTLSAPATAYHFAFQYKKPPIPDVRSYDAETVRIMDFLTRASKPGDVVLLGRDLMGPVCALTRCRVPIGYFSTAQVSSRDFKMRSQQQSRFWEQWRSGKPGDGYLRATGVRYVVVGKEGEGIPKIVPPFLTEAFTTLHFAVLSVKPGPAKEEIRLPARLGSSVRRFRIEAVLP